MSLRELQQEFMKAVYGESSQAENLLAQDHELSPASQISIYQGSVQSGLTNALGDIFPRTRNNLGAQFFDAMAMRYLRAHPSRSPSLDEFGTHFPSFCRDFPPLEDFPYVEDLTLIEWAWHCAFHAPQNETMEGDVLLGLSADALLNKSIHVIPSASLVSSRYPIVKIWAASESETIDEKADDIDLNEGGQHVLVWRPELQVQVLSLSEIQSKMVSMIVKTDSIGEALEGMAEAGLSYQGSVDCLVGLLSLRIFSKNIAPNRAD